MKYFYYSGTVITSKGDTKLFDGYVSTDDLFVDIEELKGHWKSKDSSFTNIFISLIFEVSVETFNKGTGRSV